MIKTHRSDVPTCRLTTSESQYSHRHVLWAAPRSLNRRRVVAQSSRRASVREFAAFVALRRCDPCPGLGILRCPGGLGAHQDAAISSAGRGIDIRRASARTHGSRQPCSQFPCNFFALLFLALPAISLSRAKAGARNRHCPEWSSGGQISAD